MIWRDVPHSTNYRELVWRKQVLCRILKDKQGWRVYYDDGRTDYNWYDQEQEARTVAEGSARYWRNFEFRLSNRLMATVHRLERQRRDGKQFYFNVKCCPHSREYFQFPIEAMQAAEEVILEYFDFLRDKVSLESHRDVYL